MDINKIIEKMTLDEKLDMLSGKNNWQTRDMEQYGISSIFMADGPCGLRKQTGQGDHLGIEDSIPATAAVSGGCLAATWNPACAFDNGALLGKEASAADVDLLLAPAMNIVRTPLCGRNFEYFSEDPYLAGELAAAYVKGVQSTGTGACVKHFAANNQETEREYIDAKIDERTFREIYLPAFEKAICEGKPMAVMTALNQVNGIYCSQNPYLLTEILRKEWGFEGITISDWYGVVSRMLAVKAGLDLEMPGNDGVGRSQLKSAVNSGELKMEYIDRACQRILTVVERLGENRRKEKYVSSEALFKENHQKCREIAEEGIVLLKNEENVLPLAPEETIAVIGRFAKEPIMTLSGSARVISTACDIPLEHICAFAPGKVFYAQGFCEETQEYIGNERYLKKEQELVKEALSLAKSCDKVVFFMGQAAGAEMEGHDRSCLSMPLNQIQLLEKIVSVNKKIIVVLSNASPVEMPWESMVSGIFEAFIAGQGFGRAIARLLYGDVTPSGRLPVSFTKCIEDTSADINFPGDGRTVSYGEGVFVGYRYYDRKKTDVLYPFGYGLSYTVFEYLELRTQGPVFGQQQKTFKISVSLKNTGSRPGAETIQLYIGMFDCKAKRPVKELKGFKKIFLKPGEEQSVDMFLTKKDFAYYDSGRHHWYVPEGNYEIMAGTSSRDIRLCKTIRVEPEIQKFSLLTGWSLMEDLSATPMGKYYYEKIKEILNQYMPDNSLLFSKKDLENEKKLSKMPLRFVNLLTNGIVNNDTLLEWIAEINKERS